MSLPLPFLPGPAHGYPPPVGRAQGIYLDYSGSAPDRSLSGQAEDVGRTASAFGSSADG